MKQRYSKGFTLVEIMVVIAIVAVMSTISLWQFASLKSSAKLNTTLEQIAFALRDAQSKALSVSSSLGASGSILNPVYQSGYGMHFELGNSAKVQDASDTSYILFIDYKDIGTDWSRNYLKNNLNLNGDCNPAETITECVQKYTISTGDKIIGIDTYTTGTTPAYASSLDVTFLRPNLDAIFYVCTNPDMSSCGVDNSISRARIYVKSSSGLQKAVTVWSTGHVSIDENVGNPKAWENPAF